jgi:hypothetical protein
MTDETFQDAQPPSFKIPSDIGIKIWRYMNLAKYLAILQRRSLFFTRASLLVDPFEGSSTKVMVAAREHMLRDIGHPTLHLELAHYYKVSVNTYLISCWHMNEQESAAMWSLYSYEGVCIQSTYQRLRSSLPKCVFIGEVNYPNYDNAGFSPHDLFNFIMHKRKSFEHERELRAIFWQELGTAEAQNYKPKIEPAGLWISVDLSALIEKVYINPTAEQWLATVIREVTAKYELQAPVFQSTLAESPLY